ncbi:hypothetical protein POUND7_005575 [Theobroma cacao]
MVYMNYELLLFGMCIINYIYLLQSLQVPFKVIVDRTQISSAWWDKVYSNGRHDLDNELMFFLLHDELPSCYPFRG